MRSVRFLLRAWSLFVLCTACSPKADEGEPSAGPGTGGFVGTGGVTGASGGGGGVSTLPPSGSGGLGFINPIPNSTGGRPLTSDAACGASTLEAEVITRNVVVEVPYEVTEEVPKALYVMLDRSGSMVQDDLFALLAAIPFAGPILAALFPPGTNKWKLAVDGLTQFVNDPASNKLKMALHYFPNGGQCDGTGYDVPTVPMGPMAGTAAGVVSSLTGQVPAGNTPTAGALRGLISFCEQYQAANQKEQCVGVLVTDGAPTECDPRDAGGLGQLAAQAKAKGIQIFAAGMAGANFNMLDEIGRQGGGDCTPNDPQTFACNLTTAPDAFLKAMQAIGSQTSTRTRTETRQETQSSILPCEWKIPPPKEGEKFDSKLVNVQFSGTNVPPESVGMVEAEADCSKAASGWFYDNPAAPQNIKVCAQTCTRIQATQAAKVNILFGCATEPAKIE